MPIVGVVSEFDPFHNGHLHLLTEAKRLTGADVAVTVMGGDFSQRGTVSMLSKQAKTECALLNGFDLVLELPVTFAVASAERFAFGAVSILDACKEITHIAFGSECSDVELLKRVAMAVTDKAVTETIKALMASGMSFAAARKAAVSELVGDCAEVLSNPNDILAVEYIKALNKLNSRLIPVAIKRTGAFHGSDTVENGITSASHIRSLVQNGGDINGLVPAATESVINREGENGNLRFADDRVILSRLRAMDAKELSVLPEVREGLENRLYSAAKTAVSAEMLAEEVSCRRYTKASVRRITLYALLNITAGTLPESPEYIRVLGVSDRGTELLHSVKRMCDIPIITKSAPYKDMLAYEIKASDIAATFATNIQKGGRELTGTPILTKYLTKSENSC